jgi:hypothetical protein
MTKDGEMSPSCYALGSFFLAPVLAAIFLCATVVLVAAWPFIPFLVYLQRKVEAAK